MGRKNTSNPHDADPDVFHKETNMSVQKARVMAANGMPDENGFHTVRIEVYGDEAPYTAPVITPMYGCVWVPEPGTDVAVIFSEADKPWVIGSWYAVDRIDQNDIEIPDYEPGDMRIGNPAGSHVTMKKDGSIQVRTDSDQPVNIDHQSAVAEMSTDQQIDGDDQYYDVDFDTPVNDPEGLFSIDETGFVIKDEGQHAVQVTLEMLNPKQNNRFTLGLFQNDTLIKRRSRQSVVNQNLTIVIDTRRYFDAGDVIEARLRHNTGETITVNSNLVATEFSIERMGI